jgi:hypothetical protein
MNKLLNGKEYVRKLVSISYVSISGPLLVFVWIYLEVLSDKLEPIVQSNYHPYVLGVVVFVSLLFGVYSYDQGKKLLREARVADTLVNKLTVYKKKTRLQHAIYGIISAFIAIGFYLTGYAPFEFLFFVMIFLVSVHQPNANRTVRELALKDAEKDVLTRGLDF